MEEQEKVAQTEEEGDVEAHRRKTLAAGEEAREETEAEEDVELHRRKTTM